MPRRNQVVEETPGGYRPIQKVTWPVKPPPEPEDSYRSAVPPAYWKDRGEKKG
jgi:hypothetical protein